MNHVVHPLFARQLAERPLNADGQPLCKCGALVGKDQLQCADCRDEVGRRWAREQQEKQHEKQHAHWFESIKRMTQSFPTWPHALVASENFRTAVKAPALRAVAERYEPAHGNLVLLGDTGQGKTTTVDAIAQRLAGVVIATSARTGWNDSPAYAFIATACFVRVAELVRALRRHRLGAGHDAPELERAMEASWLVLDDLGNEPSGFEQTLLDILDERYERRARGTPTWTFVTSGMKRAQLIERYGSAAVRRFVDPKGSIVEAWVG